MIIHDGVLSPLVLAIGAALRRFCPTVAAGSASRVDHGRDRYLIAVPLIFRRGTQPPSKTQVLQDYALNWGLLLGVIGAAMLILYAIRVARDKSLSSG